MIRTIGQQLLDEGLLTRDEHLVVGVSGGADSVALLHVLLDLNEKFGWGLRLHVAHLNHQLRGTEAEKDAAFVLALSDSLSLPCTIESRDVAAIAGAEGIGVEEIGRRERYAFFERVCLQTGAKTVAVGHHADDRAETILHRILRGTGLRGLAGMPRSRPLSPDSDIRLIRPLLVVQRQAIRTYLSDSGITFREDRSNASHEPVRNRLRNIIIPQIESAVNPQVRDALVRLGEQARWVDDFVRETVERTFDSLVVSRTDQVLVVNGEALARKSRILQTELVRLAYRSFGLGEQDLGFSHMIAALDLIADPGSGKQVQLPGGMMLEKRYHQLVFCLPSEEPRETIAEEVAIHLPGRTVLSMRRLQIECRVDDVAPEDISRLRRAGSSVEEYVDFSSIRPPLVVRPRRPGDRFLPLGAPGSKKLSDFLADQKVDPKERERVPVLCDRLGPIWVIGFRIDDRVKLTALTRRVLHLSAKPLNA
jgi:tRNA(Ile)-lysidine synthase